jgi:hypothetical protein
MASSGTILRNGHVPKNGLGVMLIIAGLWFAIFISTAAVSKNSLLSVVWLVVAIGGPALLDFAILRGTRRKDLLGRWCRRQRRNYRMWWR